ncbi:MULTISPECIES: PTS galactitol transporter subunit IIC [Lactiplantibacillus]|jgi:galactitol PTS system EIIC component|uniref:PTS galactitol transporter subunit IIC n=1 Tax=Lactiplantibacillus TaxID=2767842 RepID=UPI000437BF98|nr:MULTISPECIES: PTS transporter subunit IIC [Lactiplantibacillus]EYR71272.1 PTS galactitol transporter subunit IIC [Lactiplantibacillus plantarum WHE 92]AMO30870.1 PTS system galactitol-specific transporter subunit IIC [Lactiplantibacillus plantarum]ARK35649.1 PTS galactitol transporter subunit IIC [Lactiplantibacillus plantarum]AZU38076.1 PTS galactitol transporter subunit IIC [Lactiplantibacillus plantarum]KZU43082.1 PTS system galactitol-specific IIC component [Lactiplantibacillus plantaru
MKVLSDVVQSIINVGPSVMLPIIIFIVGLIFRVKPGKALTSGITVGIGMIGINLVINLLTTSVGPAAQAMVKRFGFHLTIIDAGWPAVSAGTWAQPISAIMIPIILVVNVGLILLNLTKTLDIDIWNYWHMIAAAATAYVVTKNWWFAILCGIIYEIAVLIIADKTAPKVAEFYGLDGISFPTGSAAAYGLLGIPIGWVVSKIPGIRKWDVDPQTIQKRFGVFGEPMVMGIVIGMLLAALGGYSVPNILKLGMSMGGVMFLMPRMVKILMEGLIPIQEGAQKLLQEKYGNRKIYLGMDAALSTGSPATLATGLLMVPITLFLAIILPGNRVLPFGDLATIPFFAALIVPSRKGNIVHSVLSATIVMVFALLMATDFGPTLTSMMHGIVAFPKGASEVTNLDTGGNVLNWLILKLSQLVQPLFN